MTNKMTNMYECKYVFTHDAHIYMIYTCASLCIYVCAIPVSTKQVVLCNKYPYTVTDILPASQIDRCLLSGNY